MFFPLNITMLLDRLVPRGSLAESLIADHDFHW